MKFFLVCCALSQASQEACTGGSCAESATMLQVQGRDRKQRGAAHHETHQKSNVNMMYQSAVQILREGATPEVQTFAKESLNKISGDVKQSILAAHNSDKERIEELFPQFKAAVDTYNGYKQEVLATRETHKQDSQNHKSCRTEQHKLCEDLNACRDQQAKDWAEFQKEQGEFNEALKGTDACTETGMFEDVDEKNLQPFQAKLKTVKDKGAEVEKVWDKHLKQLNDCDKRDENQQKRQEKCDEEQAALEQGICASHEVHKMARKSAKDEWALITGNWKTLTEAVTEESKQRKNEFAALLEVECLLENIEKKGGEPCSQQKDEEGNDEADKIIIQCKEGQEQKVDLSQWTIPIPTPPAEPEYLEDEPIPGEKAYKDLHYGDLEGDCYVLKDITACEGVSAHEEEKEETGGPPPPAYEVQEHKEEHQGAEPAQTILPEDGEECIARTVAGEVDFAASHTLRFTLDMPDADSVDDQHQRQWLFSAGKGAGAEHWLWSPTGQFGKNAHGHIQFGRWNGPQIKAFEGSDETKSDILGAHSLTAVYNADAKSYKLYMNGKEVGEQTLEFAPPSKDLFIGVIPMAPEADVSGAESRFTGCVKQVELFDHVLEAGMIAAMGAPVDE